MYLRNLELKDAPLMLSWMHDKNVVGDLHTDFTTKTLKDCEDFINYAQNMDYNVHYAIASDEDEYMGTVSLKHIDKETLSAEFAITLRKESMGKGYSWYGTKTIIEKAFSDLGLESVYWCVSKKNQRALRFYEKHNFHEMIDVLPTIIARYKGVEDLKWYCVLKGDVFDDQKTVAGCKVIHIDTIPTINSGEISFFEANNDVGFDIKRFYYISKVPEGVQRGFHAHKELKQLLFCPYGKIRLTLENEYGREEIELGDPSIGIVIDRPTWREILWLQKNSLLCVAASSYYETEDYIRDYDKFKGFIKNENK